MAVQPGRAVVAVVRWMGEKQRHGKSAPRVSVVVPVLNEAAALPGLFCALESWRSQIQLIVVDGGSCDASVDIAAAGADLVLSSSAGRALQQNAGAGEASGDYLVFLHCDTCIEGSIGDFIEALCAMQQWGFCRVRLSGRMPALRIIEWFMNWRASLTRIATGDQVLCFRRSFFARLGGFAAIPLMEDVELCKRARSCCRPRVLRTTALTSSRRWEEKGLLRTMITMWRLRLAYWRGADPVCLHKVYYS